MILSNAARVRVMKALLEESPLNSEKGSFYDEILDEFLSLNSQRNAFVHGLWSTHDHTKRMFLSERSSDELHFLKQREVSIDELKALVIAMGQLIQKILRHGQDARMQLATSREKGTLAPGRNKT
jgi:hypothetical protein